MINEICHGSEDLITSVPSRLARPRDQQPLMRPIRACQAIRRTMRRVASLAIGILDYDDREHSPTTSKRRQGDRCWQPVVPDCLALEHCRSWGGFELKLTTVHMYNILRYYIISDAAATIDVSAFSVSLNFGQSH